MFPHFYDINPGGKYERKADGEEETAGECLERELWQELDVSLTDYNPFKTYHFDQAAHSRCCWNYISFPFPGR